MKKTIFVKCNNKKLLFLDAQSCIICDTKSHPNCGLEISGELLTITTPCLQACFTELYDEYATEKPGKYVKRGCSSSLGSRKCETPGVCELCTGPNCNTAKFPANRLKCMKGLSGDSGECSILPLIPISEGCVTLYNDGNALLHTLIIVSLSRRKH